MNIFWDTNIFLHFRYEEIPWKEISGSTSGNIVVAPIVLKELDKHKVGVNSKRAKKAKAVLQKLNKVIEGNEYIIGGYKLVLSDLLPDRLIFDTNHLDKDSPDDQLLATILKFGIESKCSYEKILLITDDSYPKLKSISLNIKTASPPEEYFIPPDDDSKEIQKLKTEIEKIKSSAPNLSLQFKEGSYLEIERNFNFDETEDYVQEQMRNLELDYSPMIKESQINDPVPENDLIANLRRITLGFQNNIPQESIDSYNEELENFKTEYRLYLFDLQEYERKDKLSFKINLILKNIGTLPGEDIDVYLHFPDGFELFNEDEYPEKPTPPKPPNKPRSIFEPRALMNAYPPSQFFLRPSTNFADHIVTPNFSKPTIKKTNSYDVDFGLKRLKHNELFEVDPLIVVFSRPDEVKSFKINYRITCGNLREELKGNLSVKISPV